MATDEQRVWSVLDENDRAPNDDAWSIDVAGKKKLVELLAAVRQETIAQCEAAAKAGIPYQSSREDPNTAYCHLCGARQNRSTLSTSWFCLDFAACDARRRSSEAEREMRQRWADDGWNEAIEAAAKLAHDDNCWGTADRLRALKKTEGT